MKIGFILFPGLLQLDFTGPYGVLAAVPGNEILLVAESTAPLTSSDGLVLTPTVSRDTCPPLDLLLVPGGGGVLPLMEDGQMHAFLRKQAAHCRYLCSICTGALILGAAGLLRGYKATTFWQAMDLLPLFGALPVAKRVVHDRDRLTSAGISAGIDMALFLTDLVWGETCAREVQLGMEYEPEPPYRGSPETAKPETVSALIARTEKRREERKAAALRAGKALGTA